MLTRQMHDVLDLMFLCGLSEPLYSSLKDIADHIPPLLRTVQGKFLLKLHKLIQIAYWTV